MFAALRRALGLIKVTEEGDQIHIAGLPGDMVRRDIVDLWGTGQPYMGMLLAEMRHARAVVIVCPKNAVHRVWAISVDGKGDAEKDRLFRKSTPVWTSLDGTEPPQRGCRHFVVHFDALEKFL